MRTVHSVDGVLARPGESVEDVLNRTKYGEKGVLLGAIELVNKLIAARHAGQVEFGMLSLTTEATRLLGSVFEKLKAGDIEGVKAEIDLFGRLGFHVVFVEADNMFYLRDLGPQSVNWRHKK